MRLARRLSNCFWTLICPLIDMGRKGAGRKGFVKAVRQQGDGDEDEATAQQTGPDPINTPDPPQDSATDTKAGVKEPTGASATVDPEPTVPASTAEVESSQVPTDETRGQLTQRQKRENKQLKELAKKLGKKKKDELEKMEGDMEKRHAAELAALVLRENKPVTDLADKVSDSLYDVKLTENGDSKKPTKAQKRREQKLREEVEREARIAEEQEALGPSDRAEEEAALKRMLSPLGLAIRGIQADGHCMYRAVEDQLALGTARTELDGSPPAHADYVALRRTTADHMRSRPEEYLPFVTQDLEDDKDPGEEFERYCTTVAETAAWGGQVELRALAEALRRRIEVYSVGLPVLQMGPEPSGDADAAAGGQDADIVRVCYQRHAYGLGEHYNSVVPAA